MLHDERSSFRSYDCQRHFPGSIGPINLREGRPRLFESGTGEDVQPTTFQACSIRRSEMLKTFGWRAFYQIDVKFA